jgi:hypothetical protein
MFARLRQCLASFWPFGRHEHQPIQTFKRPPLPLKRLSPAAPAKPARPPRRQTLRPKRARGPSPFNPLYWPIAPIRGGFKKRREVRPYFPLEALAVMGRRDRALQLIIAASCSPSAPFLSDPPTSRRTSVADGQELHHRSTSQQSLIYPAPFATDVPGVGGSLGGEGSSPAAPRGLKRKRGTLEYPECDDDNRVYGPNKRIKLC